MALTNTHMTLGAGLALLLGLPAGAMTVLVDYSGGVAADFTFEAFDGQVTPTADGLQAAVPAGTTNNFGGLGQNTNILGTPFHVSTDFLTVRVRRDAGTTASQFVVAIRERGPAQMVAGEFFSFNVDVPATEGVFVDLNVPLDPSGSNFNFNGDTEDGMLNDQIVEVSVQSRFGENNPLNLTVQSITTSATQIPEPGSIALLGSALVLGIGHRRRS